MSTDTIDFAMDFEADQQTEADKRLLVKFFSEPVHQGHASELAGRPIYKDEEFISILAPGSRNEVTARVDESYIQRFPKQWERFKKGQSALMSGTPLTAVVWLSRAQVQEFNAVNIYTVEQLASTPDSASHNFMGFQAWKQKAQEFLDLAKEQAPITKLQAELTERDAKIAALQAQLDELTKRMPPAPAEPPVLAKAK